MWQLKRSIAVRILPAGSAAQSVTPALMTRTSAKKWGECISHTSRAACEKPCKLSDVSWVQPSACSSTSPGHFAVIHAALAGDGAPWYSLRG